MKLPAFVLALVAAGASAQSCPSKPIRLVVPFAPGGSSTLVARLMSEEMAKGLGTSIVIENKPGGGGNIAMQEVARATPDGYTLIIGHVGSLAMNPYMYEHLPYDVDKDFAAVSLLAIVPNIFVVYHEVPAKNLREFVALAKAKPGQINYGSAGNGSAGHLAMEYLKQDRNRAAARTVQGHRAEHHRPDRRAHAGDLGRHAAAHAARQVRQAPRHRS